MYFSSSSAWGGMTSRPTWSPALSTWGTRSRSRTWRLRRTVRVARLTRWSCLHAPPTSRPYWRKILPSTPSSSSKMFPSRFNKMFPLFFVLDCSTDITAPDCHSGVHVCRRSECCSRPTSPVPENCWATQGFQLSPKHLDFLKHSSTLSRNSF